MKILPLAIVVGAAYYYLTDQAEQLGEQLKVNVFKYGIDRPYQRCFAGTINTGY